MVKLQKSKLSKYFYYPAISYLNIEDAKKGIHAGYFDDKRTMEFTNFYILTLTLSLKISLHTTIIVIYNLLLQYIL